MTMSAKQEVILSGIRPTGRLHYGNYFGAIRKFVELQEQGDRCYYFIADYHALTTITERRDIFRATLDMLRTYVACGLDPIKSVIYRQSDVPSTAELALLFGMITNIGFLERGTTYKDKMSKLAGDNGEVEGNPLSYGLLGYPVLMAADILIVKADQVPVGEDQRQHVEMAIDIAQRFNHRFGETLKVPRPVERNAIRLPGLDGSEKMGKSEGNTLDLLDDPKTVLAKIKGVQTTTDPLPLEGERPRPRRLSSRRCRRASGPSTACSTYSRRQTSTRTSSAGTAAAKSSTACSRPPSPSTRGSSTSPSSRATTIPAIRTSM
jgi:tryptophanyl-tRNA synthetase